jgi:hypothetical protein
MGWTTEKSWSAIRQSQEIFFSPKHPVRLHALPHVHQVPYFFPGVERPEHEGEDLPPSNAEVKNEWSFISTRPYAFVLWTETKLTSPLKLDLREYWNNGGEQFSVKKRNGR